MLSKVYHTLFTLNVPHQQWESLTESVCYAAVIVQLGRKHHCHLSFEVSCLFPTWNCDWIVPFPPYC